METIIENIEYAQNEYDILSLAYEYIITNKQNITETQCGTEFLSKFSNSLELKHLNKEMCCLFQDLFNKIIGLDHVKSELKKSIICCMEQPCLICVTIIRAFDSSYRFVPSSDIFSVFERLLIGPLNSFAHQKDVLVYPKPDSLLIDYISEKARFRNHNDFSPETLNSILKMENFILIKKADIHNKTHKIIKYLDRGYLQKNITNTGELKIGVAPVCGYPAMNIRFEGETFCIDGASNLEIENNLTEKYLHILEKMIQDKVNIAVFPEILLTTATITRVKEFLKASPADSSLGIIFCGTIWQNFSNILYVLTGRGKELMTYKKVTPFEYKHDDGKSYLEHLKPEDEDLTLIDIDGIGRIICSVCKDFQNANRIEIPQHILNCNIAVVSAYSPSIQTFKTYTNVFAERDHGISVICNACGSIAKKTCATDNCKSHKVGYLTMPSKVDTLVKGKNYFYSTDYRCIEGCRNQACYIKYSIKKYNIRQTRNSSFLGVDNHKIKIDM